VTGLIFPAFLNKIVKYGGLSTPYGVNISGWAIRETPDGEHNKCATGRGIAP